MTKSESGDSLSIMSYNIQCVKRSILPIANTESRRDSLVSFILDLVEDHDLEVLVLQELFMPDIYNQLKEALKTKLFYSTGIIGIANEVGNWNTCLNRSKMPFHLLNGGVCIFSKYPIIEKHQLIFSNAAGTCKFVKKGAALSIIDKNGVKFIIIGLHLQANQDEKYMNIRKKQMEEVSTWVFELYNKSIPSSLPYFVSDKIPIIVAGDFNTCILNENHFFNFILKDKQQLLQLCDTFDGKKPDATYSTFTNDFCKFR